MVKDFKDVQPFVLPSAYQDCVLHSLMTSLKEMGDVATQRGTNTIKQASEFRRLTHSANHLEAHIVKVD